MASLSDKYKNNLPFDSSNVTTIISDYTALNNDVIFVNTASSALTVTLPASPTAGSKIKILDVAANAQNNIITILGNGKNIAGASAYIINTPDSSADLIYINSNKGWNILNEYISISKPLTPTSISAVDVGTGRAYNNGAATVSFTPSPSGDSAASYTVTSTPGSFSATGTSSPIVVTGLQSNTSYTFKVYASNAAGNSTESIASDSVTATTVPESPTISTVDYGFEKLSVNYTVGATGGKAVSAYTATRTGAVTASGNSPISFTGLTGGTAYTISMIATNANGNSIASNSVVQTPFTASGGSITTSGGYRIHTFTGSSNFALTGNSTLVDYLVVAGGGMGRSSTGGGGGAGGVRSTVTATGGGGSLESAINLSSGDYTVTVGAGSAGGNGSNSVFASITSIGGGMSGYYNSAASTGGSGGGGASHNYPTGAAGTINQGYAGGNGNNVSGINGACGGGGGAGAVGANAVSTTAGNGGAGITTSISGTSTAYGGGGGGGSWNARGTGGIGGGGNGNSTSVIGSAGTANTGGGGGGGGANEGNGGFQGGSGIVIIRYAI
jgi:hypothetical protein